MGTPASWSVFLAGALLAYIALVASMYFLLLWGAIQLDTYVSAY